jgi:dTDP-glucose 4,6-dehydratase
MVKSRENLKFLITGGAGFIGSAFSINLLKNEYADFYPRIHEVCIVDDLTYAGNLNNLNSVIDLPNLRFVKGNICDEELMRVLISDHDVIFNFAAETHVDRSIVDAKNFIDSNISGVQVILNILREYPDKRFIQISTDEVYGSIDHGSANEKSPLLPNSPYSASKASGDLLVRAYQKTFNLNTIITRSANNFGPNQNPEKLIPNLIFKALNNLDLEIYGNGKNIREWVHVEDNCLGIAIASKSGSPGGIYNIGGDPKTNIEIAEFILDQFLDSKSKVVFVNDRLGHDFRYSVNDLKLKSIGYRATKKFDLSLLQLISEISQKKLQNE